MSENAGVRFVHRHGGFGEKYLPETMGSGGGFIDFDGDGWLDIVLLNEKPIQRPGEKMSPSMEGDSSSLVLYHNQQDGSFKEVTAGSGLERQAYTMGCAVGDYDNDGRDDLFVTTVNEPNLLFRNLGKGKFQEVGKGLGVNDQKWGTSSVFLDYDRDGWLDLFVANYVHYEWGVSDRDCFNHPDGRRAYCDPRRLGGEDCILYRNEGGKRFRDVSRLAKIAGHPGKALGVAICDVDVDGYPDLAVANDTEPNFLFHNQRNGTFSEIGTEAGIAVPETGEIRAGMGIDAADCFNDGRVAVLVSNFSGEGLSLFHQDAPRSSLFRNISPRAGTLEASLPMLGFGLCFFDYDNDGWQDAVVANGHIQPDVNEFSSQQTYAERKLLFRNQHDGSFAEVGALAGEPFRVERVGRGIAYGDYDNDGDLDLLVTNNNQPAELLRNDSENRQPWLQIELMGHRSNRNGLGARVELVAGRVRQRQWVRGGGSYLSASMRRLHFGLGKATRVERVEVHWPDGKVQVLKDLAANQRLVVKEAQ